MADAPSSTVQGMLKYADLLLRKGMQEEARSFLLDILANDPGCARAHYLLASIATSEGAAEQAAEHFQEALRLVPDDVKAWNGLGVALQQVERGTEAASCYAEALRIDPRYQDARINLATLLQNHGMLSAAETGLAAGIELDPGSIRLCYNLANILQFQGKALEAIAMYRQVLRLNPEHLDAQQNLLFALHYPPQLGDREIFEEHLAAARKEMFRPPLVPSHELRAPDARQRIRIGYVSADFRDHAVARFIEPILAQHDRSRFQIFCYSNVGKPDQTTERLRRLADEWREIRGIPDEKAAFMIASDGIEILVDLAGHTSGNRLPIFARKPAPVQVTWIGYPDTTALPQMDYRVTDPLADPPGREMFHSEKLIRLPRSFSCFLPPEDSPMVVPPPCHSTGSITFGSFNNLAKVTPEVIALWCRILREVPGSRLLVKGRPLLDSELSARFLERFAKEGIEPGRIELHGGSPSTSEHLGQYARVDIALDTFPYNGTTTTCEALWMGVPVVTLAGTRHASRTGVSILTNCGLAGLVAGSGEEYVGIARGLAGDVGRLRELRGELRSRLQASAVMDAEGVTRELERALLVIAPSSN